MNRTVRAFIIVLVTMTLIIPAGAHVPGIAGGQVTKVPDAAKSYAWYGTLDATDEADSYLMTLVKEGEIRLSLSTPDPGASPDLALLGPGISAGDPLPEFIEIPEGYGTIIIPVDQTASASYEPFTPMALYERAAYARAAPESGEYQVVVFGNTGRYVLATGYLEEFSIAEWVMVPVQVLSLRAWQGQPLALVLLPILGSVLLGMYWFSKKAAPARSTPGAWLLAIAGFAYLGSGVLVLAEMVAAGLVTGPVASMAVTVFFAAIPILLGILMVRKALSLPPDRSWMDRGLIILYGILGFVFWAGAVIGPVLAIAAAFIPAGGVNSGQEPLTQEG
jgi:hypothetical protein